MGYELRVERESPLDYAELARVLDGEAGYELRGSPESGEVVASAGDAAHTVATWNGAHGRLSGTPVSDWHVAQLARVAELLGGRLVGEDGEEYGIRVGILEQVHGSTVFEFGKLDEIIAAGPEPWRS